MEYLEDYDFTLHYHPGKANVVANALSRKSRGVLESIASWDAQDCDEVRITVPGLGLSYFGESGGYVIPTEQSD